MTIENFDYAKELIMGALDTNFENERVKYLEHKKNVVLGLKWWYDTFNGYPVTKKEGGDPFINSYHLVNGVVCLLIDLNFSGAPFYSAEITVRPLRKIDDAGSGAGELHKIIFKDNAAK